MLIGGVPYDASQDPGCADCGPNGRPESAQARVYRWAHDCQQSSQPACQTTDGALADSVARLYGEYQCQGRDWATSGFTAPPPNWATSRHNDPALFASPTCGGTNSNTTSSGASAPDSGVSGSSGNGTGQACLGTLCVSVDIPIPNPGQLANAVLQSLVTLPWGPLVTAMIKGFYTATIGDTFNEVSQQIALILLSTPNLLLDGGGMRNIQQLVDAFRGVAAALCLAIFAFTVVQLLLGQLETPLGLLGRLAGVLFAIGFYRDLISWLLRGTATITAAILTIGQDETTDLVPHLLLALLPTTTSLWFLISIAGALTIIVLGVVKILGLGFLLLTYVAGPLLLPLAIHPRAAGFVEAWAEHLVKALLWPALWAIELRIFGALTGGLGLLTGVDAAMVRGNIFTALAAMAMLCLLVATPWGVHTKITLRQTVGVVLRHVGEGVALAATGGMATTVKGAAMYTMRQRRSPAPVARRR